MASDYAMGESDARTAATRRVAAGGTLAVLLLAGLGVGTWSLGSHRVSITSGVAAAVVGLVMYSVVFVRRTTDRLLRLADHVAEIRPYAIVIPVLSGVEMRAIARSLGSPTSGWSTLGGSLAVVSVSKHRVEVWNGREEQEPRWTVDRAGARITRRDVVAGGTPWPGIQVADGLFRIVVAPRYGGVNALSSQREDYVRRALEDLGVDPHAAESDHRDRGRSTHTRWHPHMTRQLLPGPSARWWEHAFASLLGSTGLFFVASCTAFVIPGEAPWALPSIFAFLACALLIGKGPFSPMVWIADRRIEAEYAAGYATSIAARYDVDAPVDVVDPRSRRVIRPASEPAHADRTEQKAVLKDRTLEVRSAARVPVI